MTREEYHKHEALSISRLSLIAKSPQHYKLNEVVETPSMAFGTKIHLAVLEPQKFKELYVVEPDSINGEPINKRLKAHREFLNDFRASQRPEAVILSADEFDSMAGILNSITAEIKANRGPLPLAQVFTQGQFEVPLFREMDGRPCRGMADIVVAKTMFGKVVLDLKKVGRAGGASPDEFRRVVSNLHYDAKAAWYLDLFEADAFFWLAVEEKAPYAIGYYNAEPFLEIGRKKYKGWMEKLRQCEEANDWPFYTAGAEPLYPSSWAVSQHQEDTW